MIADPSLLLEHVKGLVDPSVQETVHGIDLTIKDILVPVDSNQELVVDFDNSRRKLPSMTPLEPEDDHWRLEPRTAYVIVYNEYVKIPGKHAGFVFPRSTLVRGGATINTGVWDAGYEGRGQGLLITGPVPLVLYRNARVGQMILLKADTGKGYQGTYQRERVKIWVEGTVEKKTARCSYMVEGGDGVVVFPLPGNITEEQAEYMGIIKALKQNLYSHVEILTGSKLVSEQINTALGRVRWNERRECDSEKLKPLLDKVIDLCRGRKVTFSWFPREKSKKR